MTATRARLNELLAHRILVLDGAMATMIQQYRLTEEDVRGVRFAAHPGEIRRNTDLLVLTRPDIVTALHEAYLAAGADIIETNTFGGTAIVQAGYGLSHLAHELNREGARLARAAADDWSRVTPDRPRFVAGAIGPGNLAVSLCPNPGHPESRTVAFDRLRDAYRDQVGGLLEGGVDLLLVETVFDTLNAEAALAAIQDTFEASGVELPVVISATVPDPRGRMLAGQTLDTFYESIRHTRPFGVGLNCGFGAHDIRPHVAALARIADCYVACYPNAGLPDAFGEYEEEPVDTAKALRELAESGLVDIVGGCCGTTPAHVRAIVEAVGDLPPRQARTWQ